eukprot:scaffold3066_cov121-Skeletonema_marinoi.AAC.3
MKGLTLWCLLAWTKAAKFSASRWEWRRGGRVEVAPKSGELRRMLVCINGVRNEHDDDSIGDGLGLDIDNDEVNMLRVLIASRVMREVSDWAIALESCRLLFCYGRVWWKSRYVLLLSMSVMEIINFESDRPKGMIIKNLAFIVVAALCCGTVAAIVASAARISEQTLRESKISIDR